MTMQPGAPAQPITFAHTTSRQGPQGDWLGPNYQHRDEVQTPSPGTSNQTLKLEAVIPEDRGTTIVSEGLSLEKDKSSS